MTDINLGNIIPNGVARRFIYGGYVIALVVAGALEVAFVDPDPLWLTQTVNVLGYLGIPIGTLALANAPTSGAVSQTALDTAIEIESEHIEDHHAE